MRQAFVLNLKKLVSLENFTFSSNQGFYYSRLYCCFSIYGELYINFDDDELVIDCDDDEFTSDIDNDLTDLVLIVELSVNNCENELSVNIDDA